MALKTDPLQIATEAGLRRFTTQILAQSVRRLERGTLRIVLPAKEGLLRIAPGMPFHLWPELFLQVSGVTRFDFPEERHPVFPGDLCVVARGLPHREKIGRWRGPFCNLVLSYPLDGVVFHLAEEDIHGRPRVRIASRLDGVDPFRLAELIRYAIDLAPPGGGTLARREAKAVQGLLLTHFSLLLAALEGPGNLRPQHFKVVQARQYVARNLSDPALTPALIARAVGNNPDHLSRLFRKAVGKPLLSHLHEYRMERACDLLESSSLNIAEVARASGYRDPGYFARLFRRKIGRAPREYRRHLLERTAAEGHRPVTS